MKKRKTAMKKWKAAIKRACSVTLVLTLLVTGLPMGAYAAAMQELRAPVSAPLAQPAPVDYEAMLGLRSDADGAGLSAKAASGPDGAAAPKAKPSCGRFAAPNVSDAPKEPDAPVEGELRGSSSAPDASSMPETPDTSSVPESTEPDHLECSSDRASSLPTHEAPA